MAETRKITIEILNTNISQNNSEKKKNENKEDNGLLIPFKNLQKEVLGKNVFINQAYQQAKNLVTSAVNMSINQYFQLSEDYLGQNTYNEITKTLSKSKSLASSVIAGATVGGPGGAAIALTGWTIGEILSNQARMSNYYQSLNQTNYNTQFSQTRAGLVDNGRGTEN